jgi:hypothetical protein
MEIKEIGPHSPGNLAKMEHAKAELLAAQSFLELVEETSGAAEEEPGGVSPDTPDMPDTPDTPDVLDALDALTAPDVPAQAEPSAPAAPFEGNDTAASNYWQTLRLAFGADAGTGEEAPEEEEDPKDPRRRRRRKKRR